MAILVTVLLGLLLYLIDICGGVSEMFYNVSEERLTTINWRDHGFGDGRDFALWPMLFGGLFLYILITDVIKVRCNESFACAIKKTRRQYFYQWFSSFSSCVSLLFCRFGNICLSA